MTMAGWCFPSRLRDLRKKNQIVLEVKSPVAGAQRAAPLQNPVDAKIVLDTGGHFLS
jgi:hypothetical protein